MSAPLPNPHRHDPVLVEAVIRKIQKHYLLDLTRHPANLSVILAVAALVRLAEKKRVGPGAVCPESGCEDAARSFLKYALEHFERPRDAAG